MLPVEDTMPKIQLVFPGPRDGHRGTIRGLRPPVLYRPRSISMKFGLPVVGRRAASRASICRRRQLLQIGDVAPRLALGLEMPSHDGLLAGLGALDGESAISLADDAIGSFHSGHYGTAAGRSS
jgi:hypothetical protein